VPDKYTLTKKVHGPEEEEEVEEDKKDEQEDTTGENGKARTSSTGRLG
jgi:hypothetical protein